jgi:DNA-binding MarR family transcriptional regulator
VTAEERTGPPAPEPPQRSPQEVAELQERLRSWPLLRLLTLAGHSTGNRFRRVLADEDGLSPGAAAVLTMLAWGSGRCLAAGTPGRATHSDLAGRCMITPATLTGIVSTLEKAGYVRRERDTADRRVVWLLLTEAGATRAKEIGDRATAANTDLVRSLTPEIERLLRDFLITVIENDLAIVQEAPALTDHRSTPADPSESRSRC